MKFISIGGPHALGKMTASEELSKITDFPFFHNHATINLVFKYMTWGKRLIL